MHLVLISLPAQFSQFIASYNTQKDKWTLNEFIFHCVQEEERIKKDKTKSAHLTLTSQKKKMKRATYSNKDTAKGISKQKKGKTQDKELLAISIRKRVISRKSVPNLLLGLLRKVLFSI